MTQAVAKQNNQQQVQQHAAADQIHEQSASASASAGLNLNLFAALSGAFSSKSKKTTRQSANGDVVTDEERLDQGAAKGIAQGQGSAFAKADASQREVKAAKKRVDHLGIEG